MADYTSLKVSFTPKEEWLADIISDSLSEIGYEMFEPQQDHVVAFIPTKSFSEDTTRDLLDNIDFIDTYTLESENIIGEDWNAEWEKNYFQPIIVDGQCVVHSSFHKDIPSLKYDIVIDPKMAFGTGHHSTTMLMMRYILGMDIKDKSVIDMGTGTAILAILSAMRGAKDVVGIEIDPDAHKNSIENAALNHVAVQLICGDASSLNSLQAADIFLANINRNIITADLHLYAKAMKRGGAMMLSGFYTEDIPIIENEARQYALSLEEIQTDNNWAAIKFVKL